METGVLPVEWIIIGFNLNAMKLNRCNDCRLNSYMSQFVSAVKMNWCTDCRVIVIWVNSWVQWNWTGVMTVEWIVIRVNLCVQWKWTGVLTVEWIVIWINLRSVKVNWCNDRRVNCYMSQFVSAVKMICCTDYRANC